MATSEPKITKLKPGEGAAETKKEARKGLRGQSLKTQCIQSDGSVNPECKDIYQRSVAGREKLENYVKRLDAQGASEKDVFMAAVNSLMNRRHGYVGAYLDAKNPDRKYNKNEAMAVADSVMSKADIGENPGARLTEESDEQKKARSEKREASKEPGAVPEAGPRAMPIRQQRRQPGGRGPGLGPVPGQPPKPKKGEEPGKKEEKAAPSPVQKLMGDVKNMSPEEKKKFLEERLEQAKVRKARAGMGIGTPALPGSKSATRRDSEIEKNKQTEREDQEKRQKAAQQAKETAKKKKEGGAMQSQVAEELKKGGLGGGLETSKEDWLDDDDQSPAEKPETPESSAQKSQAFEKLTKLSSSLKNEFPNQLDLLARRELKLPFSMDKKIQPRLASGEQLQQLAAKKQQILSDPGQSKLLQSAVDGAVYEVATANDIVDDSDFDSLSTDYLNNWLKRQREQKPEQTSSVPTDIARPAPAKPPTRDSGLTPEEQAKWLPREARKTTQEGPAEQAQVPAREKLPEERLGRGKAPAPARGGGGFTPEVKAKAKTAIKQAVQEGKTPEQVVEEYKQGTLFPAGLATDTEETNPLEGGRTPEPAQESPETPGSTPAEQGSLLDEQGAAKNFKGEKKPAKEVTRQIPLPLGRETSAAKLKGRADVEKRRIERETKALGPKPKPARKGKAPVQPSLLTPKGRARKFSSSEYQQFSDAVRQVVKVRSAQLANHH